MSIRNDLVLGGGTIEIRQGMVSGNGTIGGDVTNDGGTISPGNSVQGNTSVVPEPSSLLLLAAGWLLMTFRRKSPSRISFCLLTKGSEARRNELRRSKP